MSVIGMPSRLSRSCCNLHKGDFGSFTKTTRTRQKSARIRARAYPSPPLSPEPQTICTSGNSACGSFMCEDGKSKALFCLERPCIFCGYNKRDERRFRIRSTMPQAACSISTPFFRLKASSARLSSSRTESNIFSIKKASQKDVRLFIT